jgi:methanogenic corrinoid protein MtbC1
MRDEIARGRSAAAAARAVRLHLRDQDLVASGHVKDLLAASERLDPATVRSVLDSACDELGLAAAIDGVLFPAMRQIGSWWETGRCDIAEEHLTTEAARGWLSRLSASAPAPVRQRPVVIACGPRDLHTLGGEALAVLLAYRAHSCRVLGARTPAKSLVTAVQATSAAAAVVVSHLATGRRPAADAIRALAETGCAVFYAGNAMAHPRSRAGLPGTYLGENLTMAVDLIDDAFDPYE